jgi:hypothetical protein
MILFAVIAARGTANRLDNASFGFQGTGYQPLPFKRTRL